MSHRYEPKSALGRVVNEFEETAIALILGLMTVITFINVVLRYGFNTGLIWGLEMTSFLFAWLVLFGVSYAVKVTAHLGVDAVISLFDKPVRRVLAVIAGLLCVVYAFLLFKGAWDYWANFANLPQTEGRWFPLGFEEMKRSSYRSWYEVIDIPFPGWLGWIEPLINEGEAYEKIPRFIPYAMLPIGAGLLLFRFLQATFRILTGASEGLIVSHEAEDAVEDVRSLNAEE
ncbi:2,3-diketo-L-gulonate TRAP transporter small permease protein YiaM [Thalassovita gelatinovora]|uniref:TRAP transporter small permease protein n=1 Tax=Thalassovita gelatinovora TaxID=53501 RepID=A0A0P1FEZ3_THAGE|nr:TRAP transporter small permease [Thalassovita gelatinovora]QIZ79719.1 TRAP transporter small permease [Thalassovita gelatinovora]CUH66702.1 2,3-diketo-L-gulonate TRAP transporter small permease protein YiaM [Thalassovita gelatinovora]SEQ41295.1 C4-dicarboxylate transporter, DctQ subunit [Thalassovita gelatinovora]